MIDQDDTTRKPHEDHSGCSNGFIYTLEGDVVCLFVNNSLRNQFIDLGRLDDSGAQVTFPRFYEPGCGPEKRVLVAPFDRLYLKEDAELEVVHWQLHTAHITGIDRLNFPIKQVLTIYDSQGTKYHHSDYTVTAEGHLKWINGPSIDPKTNKGLVYSIRYTYRPYFYISRMLKEVRVAQIQDDFTGERQVERMSQAAILQREYTFLSQTADSTQDASTARQARSANSGSFGPR
jgi:hypothetical protein